MVRSMRWSVVGPLVAAGCVLAACSTQVEGRATAAAGPGASAGPTTSARATARAPASSAVEPTDTPSPAVGTSPSAVVCRALHSKVPPTIDRVNAFVDALDTPGTADVTVAAATAVRVAGSTVSSLRASLQASGLGPADGLGAAVRSIDDALTRIGSAITASDSAAFNSAIDDFNAGYDTATKLCRSI